MGCALKADTLDRYMEKRREKAELDQRSRGIGNELKEIEEQIREFLHDAGKTTVKRGDWRATLVEKPNSVQWMKEFVSACGHDAATELRAAAGVREVVAVAPA